MEQRTDDNVSPYRIFSRAEWAAKRHDTPMTLTSDEVTRLRSLHDRLDMTEVEEIYLPLSRLLSLLARWPNVPKVDLVTTDGFLYPNVILAREGLMERKGFPESYDLSALLHFLSDIKAGRRPARAPVYSHLIYDVMPNQWIEVDRPDILIVEGLNVLQTGAPPKDGKAIPYVSDFFDFSIYLDADEDVLRAWYVDRFLTLRGTAFRDPKSYFHRYATLSDEEAVETAVTIWTRINLLNLNENILPTRQRADLILKKVESHLVEEVALRRL
jgi:type I pantothenate kinase